MCRGQGKIQVLLAILYAGNPGLLHGVRQDDQLVDVIPQALEEHIIFPHLRGDRPVWIEIGQDRRDLPQRGRRTGAH